MEKRQPRYVKVSHRQTREEDVSAKELTRRELFSYVFRDFFRISYDVLSIFFDALIIPEIYLLRPTGPFFMNYFTYVYGSMLFYTIYMWGVIGTLEIAAIWLEILGYRKLWPKYYTLKRDD